MTLKKDQQELLKKLGKKISRAESGAAESQVKKYTFKITAAHVVRMAEVSAASKKEAEDIMFQRYGDLPYELVEIS